MKRKNTSRNALLTSIISLLLCVSMLVGTTFAWFTDSVTSGRNTIAAGNLDVELYANDVPVNSETVLFDDVTPNLWEPGAVAYENLQVKNVGSLALQYTLTLDVLNETVVNGYKLSDVIKVGIIEGGVKSANRADVISGVTSWTKLSNFKLGMNALKLEAGEASDVFGVVLYWQPNDNKTDNHYNMNNGNKGEVLKLDIGVSLIATQVIHEFDSFGDDYDSEATPWIGAINTDWYFGAAEGTTEFTINTVDELAGLAAIVNGTATKPAITFAAGSEAATVQDSFKGKTVKLGANIDLAYSTWTPIGNSAYSFQGTFDGGDNTISNLKITGNGSYVGLFGSTTVGEIKNLTVQNAYVSGRLNVGVVAGNPYTTKYTNITVKGHVEVNGMSYVGGVGGKNAYANWDNITVSVDDTSYVKANSVENGTAYRTYVGGVVGFNGEGGHSFTNITSNIDVFGSTCDVGGAFGIAHYGNKFENITVTGDVTITNAAEAADAEEMGGIAGVWNNGGSNVTFTNCVYNGTLTANITDGVDLRDNIIVGAAYNTTGTGILYVNGTRMQFIVNTTSVKSAIKKALTDAAENGTTEIVLDLAGGKIYNLDSLTTSLIPEGTKVTIKNANVVNQSYGNKADGTVIFENCTFKNSDGAYSIHFDGGKGNVIFKNCDLCGWCTFGSVTVEMYDCTLTGNGTYALIRSYKDLRLENCYIDVSNADHTDGYAEGVQVADGATLTKVNCTEGVSTATGLVNALAEGHNVVLTESLTDAPVTTNAPYGNYYGVAQNGGVLDGNGKVLDFDLGELKNGKADNYGIMTSGGTIKNVTITGVFRGIMIMNPTEDIYIDNVTIGDEDVCYAINTGEGDGTHSLYVTNSTIKGWSSYGTAIKSLSFTNCTFAQGEYYTDVFGRLVKPYVDTVFENCEFNSKFYIDLSQLGKDGDGIVLNPNAKIVLKNCTVNGVKLTAENWQQLIVAEDDCGEGQISIEAKDGSYMTASNILDYVIFE